MSGVEALFILGVTANLASLADLTLKAIARIQESKNNVDSLPKSFRDIEVTLPVLAKALGNTRLQIKTGMLDAENCKALEPVLQDCTADIRALHAIFAKSLPRRDASKLAREWKAVLSLRQEKKVEAIHKVLQSRVPILTYFHVTAATPRPLTGAGKAVEPILPAQDCKSQYIVPIPW